LSDGHRPRSVARLNHRPSGFVIGIDNQTAAQLRRAAAQRSTTLPRLCRDLLDRIAQDRLVAPISRDQVGEPVSARTPTLRALDAQHIELADRIAEDDRAFSRHLISPSLF
jgi:hypothetical protein